MTQNGKVFISGSRNQLKLTESILKTLDTLVSKNFDILIGDSEKGVDSEVLNYLMQHNPKSKVTVFTIKDKPRVPIYPNWEIRTTQVSSDLSSQDKQMVKDRVMANETTWGISILNPIFLNRYGALQVSSGTLRNTIQMLLNDKPVKLFYVYGGKMMNSDLKTLNDLVMVIESYQSEILTKEEKANIIKAKNNSNLIDLNQIKYEILNKKFNELMRTEIQIIEARSSFNLKTHEQLKLF
ncbi:hypothetical protein H9L01_05540 [Erysipelothrix inopinata]|uniref:Uncharacterized protein n=1 Tax=Erysipelothrix inopinata TaxID=225084 RepID=A0A7G9RW80_9FIRM|nr:hypothetical protein [Erysipelothrix inopinata]QNN59855.1 hypothetical protein H9L01_05540 [Erysipelothrix inopinata]